MIEVAGNHGESRNGKRDTEAELIMRCCGGDGGNSEIESIRIENLSLGITSAYKVAEIRRPPWRGLKR